MGRHLHLQIARDSLLTSTGEAFEDSIENALNAGTLFGTDHNGSLPSLSKNHERCLDGIGFIQYRYRTGFRAANL